MLRPLRCLVLTTLLAIVLHGQAQPYSGTIFIDPDIIDADDPTTLVSVTYIGQDLKTVWDYRVMSWIEINAFLYDVVFDDGLTSVGVVNPEFATPAAGQIEVELYAEALGKVPTCLRTGVLEMWIHMGVASFGGGNDAVVIHTGRGQEYITDGILEEAFVHEGTHCSLDATHATASGWIAAQTADGEFISTYAQGSPTTEDLAESMLPWLAVRHRAGRISNTDYDLITTTVPNRLNYIDGIVCDLYPITDDVGIADAVGAVVGIQLFPSPATSHVDVNVNGLLPAGARFELMAVDGRLVRGLPLNGGIRMATHDLPAGLYRWRCMAHGRLLGHGSLVVE